MRILAVALSVVVYLSGCGGGGQKTPLDVVAHECGTKKSDITVIGVDHRDPDPTVEIRTHFVIAGRAGFGRYREPQVGPQVLWCPCSEEEAVQSESERLQWCDDGTGGPLAAPPWVPV